MPKKNCSFPVLLCVCFLLTAFYTCSLEAAPPSEKKPPHRISVVSGHGSPFKIFIAKRFTLPEYTAATELQKVMRTITMVHPENTAEILTLDKRPLKNGIIIGDMESPLIRDLAEKLGLKKCKDDMIVQTILDGNIILAGNSPRAALFCVYDFAQRNLGARWIWEGEEGTIIQAKWNHFIPADFHRTHTGGIRYRLMGYDTKTGDDRNFFNARNFIQDRDFRFGGERFYGAETIQPYRSDYKEHPEYFALLDGVRYLPPPTGWSWVINGCWSNEGFTNLILERIKEGIHRTQANHISLLPADTPRRCECENCRKMIDPDESSRFYKYNAKLLREIKKEFPDLTYSVLAYHEGVHVPACKVEEVEFVGYCSYSRCYVHKSNNPDCATNHQDFDRLARWEKEKGLPMGIWDYTFDVFQPGYALPVYSYMAEQIKNYASRKFHYLHVESGPCLKFSRPARYVAMQLMWDPSLDEEKVLDEYCSAAYGPAAKIMGKYLRAAAAAWDQQPGHLSQCFNNPGGTAKIFITPALIELAEKTFPAAEEAIAKNLKKLDSEIEEKVKAGKKAPLHAVRSKNTLLKQKAALDFEKSCYIAWKELHEKMMLSSMSINAYQEQMSDLAKGKGIRMKLAKSAQSDCRNAEASIAWTEHDLLIRTVADDTTEKPHPVFSGRKDGSLAYDSDSVEIFIQPGGSQNYYQFAAGRNGDFYDGQGMSGKWDGEWSHKVITDPEKKQLVYEITIPFKNFGIKTPGSESWKIVIVQNRNDKSKAVGIPYPAHHDIGAGADITFVTGKRP